MDGIFSSSLKLAAVAVAMSAIIGGAASDAHADCGKVSITEMNWASASVVTTVAKFIMEQGYGCKVAVIPSDTVPAATSLAENGEPDIVTEMWINSAPVYQKLEDEGKVQTIAKVLSDGGEEHWWIPKYLAEKHPELKTIEGVLANPKLVGARFHNCPDGWGCRVINDNLKVAFDLKGNGMKYSTMARVKPWPAPSRRLMPIKSRGSATTGRLPRCSENTRWFPSISGRTRLIYTSVTPRPIVRSRASPLIPRLR